MSSEPIVISAKSLSKTYRLYESPQQWVKQIFFGSFRNYYKSFWALKDINMEIRHGDNVAILGRNGCGKSTLLQIICGIIRPTKGELWVNGRVAPVLALGATFDLESTGRENVLIGGAVMGLKRDDILRKMESIAEFAGIGDFMDQPIKHYSAGMRTRLAFAICVHVEADIFVVDEALSVGDEAFQRKCLDWLDDFRATGTLLFVSHSMDEVRRLCSKAIWIDNGKVREKGLPDDVIKAYLAAADGEPDDLRRFSAV